MKNTTLARTLVLALLWMIPAPATAAIITFDFLSLIEQQNSAISGTLGDGSRYSGLPLATGYEHFSWNYQGLEVAASAQYLPEDDDGNVIAEQPAFVFLQPNFAGLGVCQQSNCAGAYIESVTVRTQDVLEPTSWGLLLLALMLGELFRRLIRPSR